LKNEYSNIFKSGNHQNAIPLYASGQKALDDSIIDYSIFRYEFCKVSRKTETVKGKEVDYNVYENYNQWGVFISRVTCPSFALTTYWQKLFPVEWTTSDTAFNKKF